MVTLVSKEASRTGHRCGADLPRQLNCLCSSIIIFPKFTSEHRTRQTWVIVFFSLGMGWYCRAKHTAEESAHKRDLIKHQPSIHYISVKQFSVVAQCVWCGCPCGQCLEPKEAALNA